MKQLKRFWLNIPRKMRVFANLLAILLGVFILYILMECPAFTPEQNFRRMEKAELVGPAQILHIMDVEMLGYDHLLLADDGDAVILYSFSDNLWDQGRLIYREKKDPVTVLAAPNSGMILDYADVIDLPVFVFHDHSNAVRAELELEFGEGLDYAQVNWQQNDVVIETSYEKTWHLESTENHSSVFVFNLHAEPDGKLEEQYGIELWRPLGSEGVALEIFSDMTERSQAYYAYYIPATVRLYDWNDRLIAEEHLTIRSLGGERYAQGEGIE